MIIILPLIIIIFSVKDGYTGTHVALKGKYGGCGKCDDKKISPVLSGDDKASCTSCDGAKCNAPKADDKNDNQNKDIICYTAKDKEETCTGLSSLGCYTYVSVCLFLCC